MTAIFLRRLRNTSRSRVAVATDLHLDVAPVWSLTVWAMAGGQANLPEPVPGRAVVGEEEPVVGIVGVRGEGVVAGRGQDRG